jgi:hypothetical protein
MRREEGAAAAAPPFEEYSVAANNWKVRGSFPTDMEELHCSRKSHSGYLSDINATPRPVSICWAAGVNAKTMYLFMYKALKGGRTSSTALQYLAP